MPKSEDANASMQKVLADLWERGLPLVRERIDLLQSAASAAAHNILTSKLQTEAVDVAHKLSGSLGMFGYPRGSELAQRLEAEFSRTQPDAVTLATAVAELHLMLFPTITPE